MYSLLLHSFDHQWSFDRAFHVSPFNDRLGTYTISVRPPSYSPSSPPPLRSSHGDPETTPVKPAVRVHLHEPLDSSHRASPSTREKGPLKLTALHFTRTSMPLSTGSLITILLQYPVTLFMSLPRILKHAWILHYRKGLGVWRRPEPVAVRRGWGAPTESGGEAGQPECDNAAQQALILRTNRRIDEGWRGRMAGPNFTRVARREGDTSLLEEKGERARFRDFSRPWEPKRACEDLFSVGSAIR